MKTLIHYFKTRALRQIAQWLVVAAFSILILGAFAVADAYAAFSLPGSKTTIPHTIMPLHISTSQFTCADLAGKTADTCSLDGGCMNFDYDDVDGNSEPDSWAAEVCGPNTAYVDGELQPFELHGWVWDMNLGYVSLYCDDSGKNNGADCGLIPYGVKVDPETGDMSGWAWSDNMGWISFMCGADGLNDGFPCGDTEYHTNLNTTIGKDLGKITGYAWADTIGWFDFDTSDVHAELLDILMRNSSSETDWGVWTKAEIENDDLSNSQKDGEPLKSTMPVAGSGDGYDIYVYVADITGATVEGNPDVTVDITTQWKDTVRANQVNGAATDNSLSNGGIVVKPSVENSAGKELIYGSGGATTGGISNAYHGVAKSEMPTDGGNCYDGDSPGDPGYDSCYEGEGDFFYKDFMPGAPSDSIIYYGANVTVSLSTGETWTTTITPLGYPSGRSLEFLPQIDIPVFDYLMVPGDLSSALPFVQAIRNKVDEFNIDGRVNAAPSKGYSVKLQLSSDSPDVQYVFVDSPTDEEDPAGKSDTFGPVGNVNDLDGSVYALPYAPDSELQEFVEGASIKSIVSINNGSVAPPYLYYNNGLPRGIESAIQTQAAEILSGSVFSPGAKDVVQGSDVPLFGDTAVYELRTAILEDVSGLIRGANFDNPITPSITINDGTSVDSLYKNSFKDGQLYYFKDQDVTIQSLDNLIAVAGGNPITIVVKGGDLYIDGNIDIPDQEFGFIVFESDDDTNEATKGGRMYVHSSVTDMVNVHIFTDGPVFRYTDSICYYTGTYNGLDALREPNFVDPAWCAGFQEPTATLPNQFYLKGNIASYNCLGCSADLKPSRGDGQDLGGASALNFAIARLYDFNYFSYFRIHPVTGAPSGARSSNVNGNPAITNQDKAVYFEYSPAPTGLLGFRNF